MKGNKKMSKCEVCKKAFDKGKNQKYCSPECGRIHRAEYMKKYHQENAKPKEVEKVVIKPKLTAAEINNLALSQGMSYGEYILKNEARITPRKAEKCFADFGATCRVLKKKDCVKCKFYKMEEEYDSKKGGKK